MTNDKESLEAYYNAGRGGEIVGHVDRDGEK
jgi:hypothetical protein